MLSPCKDCPKKGCGSYHSECEQYLEYRAEKDKEIELRNEYNINRFARARNEVRLIRNKWSRGQW